MYIPEAFRDGDMKGARALVEEHAFGTLIAPRGDGALEIAHLPFLLDAGEPFGTLRAHVARPNPLASRLEQPLAVTAVFLGPHAYVTPRWYESPETSVPTWNYATVHVHGTARRLEDERDVRRLLADLTARYERGAEGPWTMDRLAPERQSALLGAIVGFAIEVHRVEFKRKLSQNRSDADHARVVRGLEARAQGDDLAVAAHMRRGH